MKKLTVFQVCVLGFATALNVVGANIALVLRLPIYLDSLGTMLSAILLGPIYGTLPGILSGVISGCTSDVYSFYYLPIQIVLGILTGILYQKIKPNTKQIWKLFLMAFCISLPGTVISSFITSAVFGGITSSGSSILVQLLHAGGLSMTASVCLVQMITDYLDRIVVLFCVIILYFILPDSLKQKIQKGNSHGTIQ